ncbi:MAG TPA: hypothetical protein VNR86_02200 [Sphingomicrobium sp.]|nr:hypothetical protein [Sphingomicrobium sp.]
MPARWARLLLVIAICGLAPASVWPVLAQASRRDGSACPYEQAREAAAATTAASSAAVSFLDLGRSAGGLAP